MAVEKGPLLSFLLHLDIMFTFYFSSVYSLFCQVIGEYAYLARDFDQGTVMELVSELLNKSFNGEQGPASLLFAVFDFEKYRFHLFQFVAFSFSFY